MRSVDHCQALGGLESVGASRMVPQERTHVRVAIGGLFHETNSLVAEQTSLTDFHDYQFAEGEGLFDFRTTRSEIGGFLAGCEEHGWTPVPTLYAAAVPGGLVDHSAYDALAGELVERTIGSSGPPDGVLVTLHGAMATTRDPDADGEMIRRLADVLGPEVPMVLTVDFHANTSDSMSRNVDALIGYDTYPHVDMYERGREAATVLASIVDGKDRRRRTTVHRKLPIITPPQVQYSDVEPVRSVMAAAHEWESKADVVVSVTPGFPYAYAPCLGLSVVASSPDAALAAEVCEAISAEVEARETDFAFSALSVEEAVDRALRATDLPVVLVDSADNVGGGGPGDGTAVLQEWMERGGSGLVIALTDPSSVAKAVAAGVGSEVRLDVGAHIDNRHGDPVALTGRVRLIGDGRYVHRGSYNTGITVNMGRSVVIESHGNTIALSERRVMPFDAQQLLSIGISPQYCRAIVVKSAVAWRAAYGEYAREVIEVDAPGVCTANLYRLGYSDEQRSMIRPRPQQDA